MIGNCKNCIFYKSDEGYKFGDCSQMEERTNEEIGMMDNPDRIWDATNKKWRVGDYSKPSSIPNPNSTAKVDKMILFSGGGYDSFCVGEDFGCILFKAKGE